MQHKEARVAIVGASVQHGLVAIPQKRELAGHLRARAPYDTGVEDYIAELNSQYSELTGK